MCYYLNVHFQVQRVNVSAREFWRKVQSVPVHVTNPCWGSVAIHLRSSGILGSVNVVSAQCIVNDHPF